jgi:hypothetical protein
VIVFDKGDLKMDTTWIPSAKIPALMTITVALKSVFDLNLLQWELS